MFYSFDVVLPASTTEASPVEVEAEMVPGSIHRVEVQFPLRCAGLAHLRILHALHQVWPGNPGGSLAGDGAIVAWDEHWLLDQEPFALILQGWNDDDSFPHTITVRFALREAAGPGRASLLVPEPPPALGTLEVDV